MTNNEKIKEMAINVGGEDWAILADAVDDSEFQMLLTNQEKSYLNQIAGNPNIMGSNIYRDHFANIVAKYIPWNIYKNSNIRTLKKKTKELEDQVEKSKDDLQTIRDTAKYIGGATVLVEYSKSFANTAKIHKDKAREQFCYYVWSLVFFAGVIALVFFFSIADTPFLHDLIADDIRGLPLNTGIFILKIATLFFVFQITQFFRKNYGAEKHLEEVYQHRSDVLQSLHAVYNALTDQAERDKILSAGALFAYERGETGYITTKEGAGSSDDIIGGIFGRIFK